MEGGILAERVVDEQERDRRKDSFSLIGLKRRGISRASSSCRKGSFRCVFSGRILANEKKCSRNSFPVGQYGRIIELARERAKSGRSRTERHGQENPRTRQAVQCAHLPGKPRVARGSDRRCQEKNRLRAAARDSPERTTVPREIPRATERRRKLSELESRVAGLDARSAEIDAKRAELEASRYGRAAHGRARAGRRNRAQAAALSAELVAVGDALDETKEALRKHEADGTRIADIRAEREALLVRKERLAVAADIAVSLETETETYRDISARLAAAKKETARIKAESAARTARISELAAEASLFEERNRESTRAREELEGAKQLRALAEDHDREAKAIRAHEGAVEKARELVAENRRDEEYSAGGTRRSRRGIPPRDGDGTGRRARAKPEGRAAMARMRIDFASRTRRPTALDAFSIAERIAAEKRRIEQIAARAADLGRELATREAKLRNARDRLSSASSVLRRVGRTRALQSPRRDSSLAEATANLRTPRNACRKLPMHSRDRDPPGANRGTAENGKRSRRWGHENSR
jgi:cell division protein FtsB